jgi:hypothetical protein
MSSATTGAGDRRNTQLVNPAAQTFAAFERRQPVPQARSPRVLRDARDRLSDSVARSRATLARRMVFRSPSPSPSFSRSSTLGSSAFTRLALLVVRSRQVGVVGIARTERVRLGPPAARSPSVQASLGIDRQTAPPGDAVAITTANWRTWGNTPQAANACPDLAPAVLRTQHSRRSWPGPGGARRRLSRCSRGAPGPRPATRCARRAWLPGARAGP